MLYSPINRKVKLSLENSVLKPLTNSLSPSDRSIGLRFNSVIIKNKIIKNKEENKIFLLIIKRKDLFKIIKINNKKKNIISKEILWFLKRIAPK